MKSTAPWSVKGIERDARETAKEAARREGVTVGEWLNQIIQTAGEPGGGGVISGVKIADLVHALEHLNAKIADSETRSVAALEGLARSFGGVVERVQRLERGGASASLDRRLRRIESKINDSQRIEALRALERAITHVAIQFDTAQRTSLGRLEATERQLQELASRLDADGAAADGAALAALRSAVEGLTARIMRAERVATEAAELKAAAGAETVDAEFIDRTSQKIRVLGDEIKRGGDQIRSLEQSIRRLAEQIDAAERRSSEGVQKVAETISELRGQFSATESDGSDTRNEIAAAVAEVSQRAEDRISKLQRSFEDMIARLESGLQAAGEPPSGLAAAIGPAPQEDAGDADEPPLAGPPPARRDEGESESDEALDAAEDFSFDLDDEYETGERDVAAEILAEVEGAFAAPRRDEFETGESDDFPAASDDDDLESLLDETAAPPPLSKDRPEAEGAGALALPSPDFIRAARQSAREEAERKAAAERTRRSLTPRQRAILAARLRRRRLAEQGLSLNAVEARARPPAGEAPRAKKPEFGEETPSLGARFGAAFAALRARFGRSKTEVVIDDSPQPTATGEDAADARPEPGWRGIAGQFPARTVTIALAIAIALAAIAVFFLLRDFVFDGERAAAPPQTAPAVTAPADPAATAAPEPDTRPEVPAPPTEQPRELYLESVARLKAATTEEQTRTALEDLQRAALLGHPPAQLQLGELYKLGQIVPGDQTQARLWYQRAANGGNVLAMHRYAVMAARGQGGPVDGAAAVAWFERAAGLGLVDSQYNLGAIFHPGGDGASSAQQDAAQAYFWYSLAARNGDSQAATLASGLARSLGADRRRELDAAVAGWTALVPDPAANETAPAS